MQNFKAETSKLLDNRDLNIQRIDSTIKKNQLRACRLDSR